MKKFTLMLSLLLGLSMFSCKEKDEPVLDFKLSQNELSLIVGEVASFKIESGNAPYTLSKDEHIEASIKNDLVSVKALKCDESGLNASPVKLTITDKAGKKQVIDIKVYNSLDVATQDVKLFEGQATDIRINTGKLDAFKLSVKDENIASAEIASEMIGSVELKKIRLTGKAAGETQLIVSDGVSSDKTIKVFVQKIEPVSLWAAVQGELQKVENYTIKAGENCNFIIKGGTGKYVLDYDKEQLIVGEITEHGEDYIVNVALSPELTKSQEVKFKLSQEGDEQNFTEISIKADIPKQAFSCKVLSKGKVLTPTKDKDGDDVYEVEAGQDLTIKLIGGDGDYYLKKATGDELLAFGAVSEDLTAGEVQYGQNKYPSYLIPKGTIRIKNTKSGSEFADNLLVTKTMDWGIGKDSKWITIKVK